MGCGPQQWRVVAVSLLTVMQQLLLLTQDAVEQRAVFLELVIRLRLWSWLVRV